MCLIEGCHAPARPGWLFCAAHVEQYQCEASPGANGVDIDPPIDVLGLAIRTTSLLRANNIRTVRELVQHSPHDLRHEVRFKLTKLCLRNVQDQLALRGLWLRGAEITIPNITPNTHIPVSDDEGWTGREFEDKSVPGYFLHVSMCPSRGRHPAFWQCIETTSGARLSGYQDTVEQAKDAARAMRCALLARRAQQTKTEGT
jgi:hypothetical protein